MNNLTVIMCFFKIKREFILKTLKVISLYMLMIKKVLIKFLKDLIKMMISNKNYM